MYRNNFILYSESTVPIDAVNILPVVFNPITVYSYGFLFNCTTLGQASDSMTALT